MPLPISKGDTKRKAINTKKRAALGISKHKTNPKTLINNSRFINVSTNISKIPFNIIEKKDISTAASIFTERKRFV